PRHHPPPHSFPTRRSSDLSDTVTFAGIVSGIGSVSQAGGGTLILTNDNTYSGGTTISAGTLQVGAGGATGSLGAGNVTDNGTLRSEEHTSELQSLRHLVCR